MPPLPGMGMAASFRDPSRPKMVPWRWNALPANQLQKTIFKDIDTSAVKFDSDKLIKLFRMDTGKSAPTPSLTTTLVSSSFLPPLSISPSV